MTACVNDCVTRDHRADCRLPYCPGCLPRRARRPWHICLACYDRLERWLTDITALYPLLPAVLEPGTVEAAPERGHGKRADAPAPLRVGMLDLLDARLGQRSDGTTDRRGTLGLLESWATLVREQRGLGTPTSPATLTSETGCLSRNLDWIAAQPWVTDLTRELGDLYRDLRNAVGEVNPKPIGTCPGERGHTCGAPLWPPKDASTGVRCTSCGAEWDGPRLLVLGGVIGEAS